jgi:hypothetical protein
VKNEFALIYSGTPTFFYDMPHPDPMLFTGLEQCFEPSPVQMALLMRKYHMLKTQKDDLTDEAETEWNSIIQRQENCMQLADKFDYRTVSNKVNIQIKEAFASWKQFGSVQFNMDKELVE